MNTRIGWGVSSAALAAALAVGAPTIAAAGTAPADNSSAPPAVEDFAYGTSPAPLLKLLRGDGHIVPADCYTSTQIQLFSLAVDGAGPTACFRVTGTAGFLTLELQKTFSIRTVGYAVHARLTTDTGATATVDIPKDTMQNVAEGLGQKPATLVELRTG
ncbi:hypothetical protein ACFVVX_36205 [Kitasatospora sp. NPDC058170]|uniref:hypothetical protein n=1 Tax=Kitasatospora sp. NPDC058170 TaxID=3346364 RepID=UPI0036D87FFE